MLQVFKAGSGHVPGKRMACAETGRPRGGHDSLPRGRCVWECGGGAYAAGFAASSMPICSAFWFISRKSRGTRVSSTFMMDSGWTSFVIAIRQPQHADVEDDRPADLLHHRLVHRQLHLPGVHLALDLDVAAVGDEQTARPEDGRELGIGLLRQADQHVGLDHLGKVDGLVGDDDVGAGRAPPRLRAVGLGLNGDEIFTQHGRLGQNDGGRDHPLPARTGKHHSASFHHLLPFIARSTIF